MARAAALGMLTVMAACGGSRLAVVSLTEAGTKGDFDYLLCDRKAGRVWVPAGGAGTLDVIDARSLAVSRIGGFATTTRTIGNHAFRLGPTAIALGDGVAYVGNRGDARICAVDAKSLAIGTCIPLGAPDDLSVAADGMAYVGATKELWITRGAPTLGLMPPEPAIWIFDQALAPKGKVDVPGAAEGYAVDDAHATFYTNVVDKDLTLAIDVRERRVRATWRPECGADGPRGVAVDSEKNVVFVACTDHVVALDASKDGARIAEAPAGAGIDNIDYVPSRRELFVAAGRDALLTVLTLDGSRFVTLATKRTAKGARVVVADDEGTAFVGDPVSGRILVVRASDR